MPTVEVKPELLRWAIGRSGLSMENEEYAPEVKRKVPIPNVFVEFDIEYTNTFEMLRDLKVKFIRKTKKPKK